MAHKTNNQKEMRAVYCETLIQLAQEDERIILLDADLMNAHATRAFKDLFPERTFDVGVAEANMVGIAAGLSTTGKIPFANSFATFSSRRAFDQFFQSANYARLNVKLVGSDPGITAALNGGTHMAFEDIGLMRTVPNLVVFEPCDPVSLRALVRSAAFHQGCTYMRLHRKFAKPIYADSESFTLGKGKLIQSGEDVAIFATGPVMINEALQAADRLLKDGIHAAVVDMHTIKPIDRELVIELAESCGAIVTCENHQIINGLGSAVAEVLAEELPTPMLRVGVQDQFGEVGSLDYLIKHFGLTAETICEKAKKVIGKKNHNK